MYLLVVVKVMWMVEVTVTFLVVVNVMSTVEVTVTLLVVAKVMWKVEVTVMLEEDHVAGAVGVRRLRCGPVVIRY